MKMKQPTSRAVSIIGILCLCLSCLVSSSCSFLGGPTPRFGIGGSYNEGREQFTRGRGGDMDRAVEVLESVVRQDPWYRDSLTLLGRAYYRKGRFRDANQILQRALVINKDDEIAWLTLGMTQLRFNDDERAMTTLKGGITLVSQVAKFGYRGYPEWDVKGLVRNAISRAGFEIIKGPEAKENILRACDTLLARMDDEENYQKNVAPVQFRNDMER